MQYAVRSEIYQGFYHGIVYKIIANEGHHNRNIDYILYKITRHQQVYYIALALEINKAG